MVKVSHFQMHAGLLPEQLSAGAGSPRSGRRSRRRAAAAEAPSDSWTPGGAALLGRDRFRVPPRRCLRDPAGQGCVAGLGRRRRCCWGGRCCADFLFRPRPEDAETPRTEHVEPRIRARRPPALLASLRRRAPGGGTGRGSSLLPDLDAAGSPGKPGTVSRPSFSWKSPSAALRPSDDPGARSLNSSAHQQVLAPLTRVSPVSSFSKITATTLSKPPRLTPPYWSLFPLLIAHYPYSSPRERAF